MPRIDDRGGVGDGVHIPGIYQALLVREREHYERWGGRKVYSDPDDPSKGFFLWDRHLLDALEAGEPVTLSTSQIGGRRLPPEWRWWTSMVPGVG